jgi:hypothetical protein
MKIPNKQKSINQGGTEPRHQTKVLFCIDSLDGGRAEKLLVDILNRMDYAHFMVDLLALIESNQLKDVVQLKGFQESPKELM